MASLESGEALTRGEEPGIWLSPSSSPRRFEILAGRSNLVSFHQAAALEDRWESPTGSRSRCHDLNGRSLLLQIRLMNDRLLQSFGLNFRRLAI